MYETELTCSYALLVSLDKLQPFFGRKLLEELPENHLKDFGFQDVRREG